MVTRTFETAADRGPTLQAELESDGWAIQSRTYNRTLWKITATKDAETIADKVKRAAAKRNVEPAHLALSQVIVARIDGQAPPPWAVALLRALSTSVDAELS